MSCAFEHSTGTLVPSEPVHVWQERCWSESPSPDLKVREGTGGRSGLDAAWVSPLVGVACFGERNAPTDTLPARDDLSLDLQLGGGVRICGKPNLLEVILDASPRASGNHLVLRRRWEAGTVTLEVEERSAA